MPSPHHALPLMVRLGPGDRQGYKATWLPKGKACPAGTPHFLATAVVELNLG